MKLKLIVGLGNPGSQYENTRHNAGVWMLEQIARTFNANPFTQESKFQGLVSKISYDHRDIRLLFPTTYMNLSGQSVAALAQYYKIEPESILVIHDELDLATGSSRFKQGGGHGGHNGLRDIINHLGKNFYRLRIGIARPKGAQPVVDYVLKAPSTDERALIDNSIADALKQMEVIFQGELQKAMKALHSGPQSTKTSET